MNGCIQGFRGEVSRKLAGEGWGGQGKVRVWKGVQRRCWSEFHRSGRGKVTFFLMVTVEGGFEWLSFSTKVE